MIVRSASLALAFILGLSWPFTGVIADEHPAIESPLLEEVIVTAQRRPEPMMRVPMAVTALDGKLLDYLGALDLGYLGQITPNTTIEVARGTNNAIAAYIRGVGQQDHIAGFETGVGLYVDDVLYNRPQLALLDIYDVERIEVLRGPQGTLYGRNTVGGAIKYVTRRLAAEPELQLRSRIGNYDMRDVIVSANMPVGDSLRIGGSLASFNLDGFGENLYVPGQGNYEKDTQAARLTAEWEPSERWFVRLAGDWLQDDSSLRRGHRTRVGGFSGAPVLDNVYDSRSGNTNPPSEADSSGVSLLAEWQASDALEFRAILASRHDENWKPVDLDGLPTVDVDVSLWDHNRQQTGEFQALYTGNRVKAVAGLFALDASADTVQGVVLSTTGELIGRPGLGNELRSFVDTRNWAVFADASMDFSERWSGSLGARYTHDERTALVRRRVLAGGVSSFFGGTGVTVTTTSDFTGSEVFEKVTPRAVLQFRPAENQQVYLSYSEGFKGGGFDPRGLSTLTPDFDNDGVISPAEVHAYMRFEPEEVDSWELGWKATLFGGRANSRLALFSANYKDVQIPGSVGVDENGDGVYDTWVGKTSNAASAPIDGAEWEGQAVLGESLGVADDRLELSWAVGYMDARFEQWVDEDGNDVASERHVANTPEWMMAATANYSLPVRWFHSNGRFSVITTLSYRDKQYQFVYSVPEFDQPAYTLWDLSMIWTPQSERWQLALYGRNLTDERVRVAGLDIELGLEDNYTVYYGNPRQYWLDLQYRFN
jgi:iron complex outermembrane receptor protein